jgi:hypothetical protein
MRILAGSGCLAQSEGLPTTVGEVGIPRRCSCEQLEHLKIMLRGLNLTREAGDSHSIRPSSLPQHSAPGRQSICRIES